MCGIEGVMKAASTLSQLDQSAMAMADSLAHRGPDDSGPWSDADAGIALAHRG
jgi:asparagine synthase (glutamine-hydrolysing)